MLVITVRFASSSMELAVELRCSGSGSAVEWRAGGGSTTADTAAGLKPSQTSSLIWSPALRRMATASWWVAPSSDCPFTSMIRWPTLMPLSLEARDPGFTLTQKTPSSAGSRGLPGWPLRPPLMIMPSFSPGSFTTAISLKPAGRGSCCTVSFITWQCCSRAITASWCVTTLMSVVLTASTLSPIRSLPVAAAAPPGMILLM